MSAARKLFQLGKWVQYWNDFRTAREEPPGRLRQLLFVEASLNLTIDVMIDAATLDRIGVLSPSARGLRPNRLPSGFELWADRLDMVRAAASIGAASIRRSRLLDPPVASAGAAKNGASAPSAEDAARREQISKQRVALLKNFCDLSNKADASGVVVPGERLAALAGLVASLLSARKLVQKAAAERDKVH